MGQRTRNIAIRTSRPDRVVDALARKLEPTDRCGILFVSGDLTTVAAEIAQALAVECRHVSWLILPGAGVLTEQGETERESAAVALITSAPMELFLSDKADPSFGERVCRALDHAPGASAFVATRGDEADDGWLQLVEHSMRGKARSIFGGGTLPRLDLFGISDGQIKKGRAACAILPGLYLGRFRSSSACRLISPLRKVTKARGPVLHEMEGMLALERLSEATSDLDEQPLVMLALAAGDNPLARTGRSLALRAIQGVDPGRGALIMGEEIPVGTRVAFAVRDPHAARVDLQAQLQNLRGNCAGSIPEFGIYVSCAGRGSGLYGMEDVDTRMIKKAFPKMPLVGMHSTFELAPLDGRTVPQIYTGVLGVFCIPS